MPKTEVETREIYNKNIVNFIILCIKEQMLIKYCQRKKNTQDNRNKLFNI